MRLKTKEKRIMFFEKYRGDMITAIIAIIVSDYLKTRISLPFGDLNQIVIFIFFLIVWLGVDSLMNEISNIKFKKTCHFSNADLFIEKIELKNGTTENWFLKLRIQNISENLTEVGARIVIENMPIFNLRWASEEKIPRHTDDIKQCNILDEWRTNDFKTLDLFVKYQDDNNTYFYNNSSLFNPKDNKYLVDRKINEFIVEIFNEFICDQICIDYNPNDIPQQNIVLRDTVKVLVSKRKKTTKKMQSKEEYVLKRSL